MSAAGKEERPHWEPPPRYSAAREPSKLLARRPRSLRAFSQPQDNVDKYFATMGFGALLCAWAPRSNDTRGQPSLGAVAVGGLSARLQLDAVREPHRRGGTEVQYNSSGCRSARRTRVRSGTKARIVHAGARKQHR
ncbi:unnamed protein product [Lampetra planeri]